MPLEIDLNMPLEIDLNMPLPNMPLEIDLNIPFNEHEPNDEGGDKENGETVMSGGGSAILEEQHELVDDDFDEEEHENVMSDEGAAILEEQHELADDDFDMEDLFSDTTEGETEPSKGKRAFLSNTERDVVAQILTNESNAGKLKRGIVVRLASTYSVSKNVIYRISKQIREGGDAHHKRTVNCGRKRIEFDIEKVRDVPLNKRSTFRALGRAIGVNKNILLNYKKEGKLRRHSSALKPYLNENNMKSRLRFCLSMLEENSIPHDPQFKSMYNVVHIDEKWFEMTQKTRKYYLLSDENEPHRTCKNKNYITKIMFLVAMARPRFDDDMKETFSGKIGVFPLVHEVPAIRSSVNRPSGTLVTKPITSITKEVSRMFLINKVLPAIKEKWPRESIGETIYIQQDNAPCHVRVDDAEFCKAASEGGFDIRLTCQPPNSPDLNVLDLGFFSAIQSLQQMEVTKTVNELVHAVQKAFDNFSSIDSNKIFLSLQLAMVEIMKTKGNNDYKPAHMSKDALFNQDKLPTHISCDRDLVTETLEYLNDVE